MDLDELGQQGVDLNADFGVGDCSLVMTELPGSSPDRARGIACLWLVRGRGNGETGNFVIVV